MINSWTNANYLGHKNLKNALDMLKRSRENNCITPSGIVACTGADYRGEGTYGDCAILQVGASFSYRIEDTMYEKGAALIPGIIPHTATDGTKASDYDVTAAYWRAGILLIDSDGAITVKAATTMGISSKPQALMQLISELDNDDLESKAVIGFFVIGDGSNAFLSTASLLVGTNLDVYSCGGMALSSGLSTDGNQMLAAL